MASVTQFNNFPKGWQTLPFLDAIKDVTGGNSKIKQTDANPAGVYPVIDQGQQENCGFTDNEDYLCKEELPTILFGDHTKIIKLIDYPFALGADGVKVLTPKVPMDKKFLFYFLKTLKLPENAGYSRHYKFLKDSVIPIPPITEQKRIAAILDKADSLRRKNQQAIQLADKFLRAEFLDMFGDPVTNPKEWDKQTLGDLIKVSSGNGLTASQMDKDGKFPVYGGNGINGYHNDYMFEEPQIVIGRVGVYCGSIHITWPKSWITDNALYVKEYKQEIDIHFLAESLKQANLNQYAGKAAQPLISGSRIYPLEFIIPPIQKQKEFSKIKKNFQGVLEKFSNSSSCSEIAFNAISQKAFSGHL